MQAVFHPEAIEEYDGATSHYATIQNELGHRFHDAVEAAIDCCSEYPLRYPTLEQDVRRCRAQVFPYGVLYTIESDHLLIVAIMHDHRKPGYWRHRIDPRSQEPGR